MANNEAWNPIVGSAPGRVAQNVALTLAYNGAAPLSRFNAALAQCELQADYDPGESRNTLTAAQLLAYPDLEYFRFNSAGNMVFRGERTAETNTYQFRTELRAFPEFSNQNRSRMYAEMRLSASTLNEYTFMQIHEKPPSGSVPPPLRLAWEKTRTQSSVTYNDYLWAVFHRGGSTYERIPLVARADGFMKVEIRVESGEIDILVDESLVHSETTSAWDGKDLYFKQGIYCTGSASAIGVATNETRALSLLVDEAIPDSVQVVVTGTGFGLAPNVVVYRTGDGEVGEAMPSTAPPGEIGNAVFSAYGAPTYAQLPNGITGYAVHPRVGASNARMAQFEFPQSRKFKAFYNVAIPPDAVFPGGKNASNTDGDMTHGQFSAQSGLKVAWFMYDSNSSSTANEADLCVWQHSGGGAIRWWGNSTNFGMMSPAGASIFAWNGELNGATYWQDCDDSDSTANNSVQQHRWTSQEINATKTTGTITVTTNQPSFKSNSGIVVNGQYDSYGMLKMCPYSSPLNFDPTKTQVIWRDLYVAVPSASDANDWRQCVYLTNASTIEAATRMKAVVATSWSDEAVTVTVSAFDQSWATHVIVEDSEGNETAMEIPA